MFDLDFLFACKVKETAVSSSLCLFRSVSVSFSVALYIPGTLFFHTPIAPLFIHFFLSLSIFRPLSLIFLSLSFLYNFCLFFPLHVLFFSLLFSNRAEKILSTISSNNSFDIKPEVDKYKNKLFLQIMLILWMHWACLLIYCTFIT